MANWITTGSRTAATPGTCSRNPGPRAGHERANWITRGSTRGPVHPKATLPCPNIAAWGETDQYLEPKSDIEVSVGTVSRAAYVGSNPVNAVSEDFEAGDIDFGDGWEDDDGIYAGGSSTGSPMARSLAGITPRTGHTFCWMYLSNPWKDGSGYFNGKNENTCSAEPAKNWLKVCLQKKTWIGIAWTLKCKTVEENWDDHNAKYAIARVRRTCAGIKKKKLRAIGWADFLDPDTGLWSTTDRETTAWKKTCA